MAKIIVSGLCNLENCVRINNFPLNYNTVNFPFHGVNSALSGVGLNISYALTRLGHTIDFMSISGKDIIGTMLSHELKNHSISDQYLIPMMDKTSNTVVIYDEYGKRQIHCDLKELQELEYPDDLFEKALQNTNFAVLCNINFTRKMLSKVKARNIPIATDVHVLSDIHDKYNQDFMSHADILFLSDENIPGSPEEFCKALQEKFHNQIIVCGMGAKGALLLDREKNTIQRYQAVTLRPIENTIGAGDALFSAFIHSYLKTKDPVISIKKAICFASYKIGTKNASDGFLDSIELDTIYLNNKKLFDTRE